MAMNRSSVPLVFGILLAVLGAVFLADNLTGASYWRAALPYWPVLLLVMAGWSLVRSVVVSRQGQKVSGAVWVGEIVFATLVILIGLASGFAANWKSDFILSRIPLVGETKTTMNADAELKKGATFAIKATAADIEVGRSGDRKAYVKVVTTGAGAERKAAITMIEESRPSLSADRHGNLTLNVPVRDRFGFLNFGYPRTTVKVSLPAGVLLRTNISRGDVSIRAFRGNAYLETQMGDINVTGLHGALVAGMQSGDATVADVSGAVRISTQQGDVRVTADKPVKSAWTVITQAGDISARFPSGSKVRVLAVTQAGDIKQNISRWRSNGDYVGSRYEAKLTGGGPLISTRTQAGDIRLQVF